MSDDTTSPDSSGAQREVPDFGMEGGPRFELEMIFLKGAKDVPGSVRLHPNMQGSWSLETGPIYYELYEGEEIVQTLTETQMQERQIAPCFDVQKPGVYRIVGTRRNGSSITTQTIEVKAGMLST